MTKICKLLWIPMDFQGLRNVYTCYSRSQEGPEMTDPTSSPDWVSLSYWQEQGKRRQRDCWWSNLFSCFFIVSLRASGPECCSATARSRCSYCTPLRLTTQFIVVIYRPFLVTPKLLIPHVILSADGRQRDRTLPSRNRWTSKKSMCLLCMVIKTDKN
jgi:hypothetical protein